MILFQDLCLPQCPNNRQQVRFEVLDSLKGLFELQYLAMRAYGEYQPTFSPWRLANVDQVLPMILF
jgi:hypothetical protein